MDLILQNLSIVIIGESHNPTVLNPDFLRINGIVPLEWGWEIGEPVMSTPPISVVTYNNGVSISVQPERFQVLDEGRDPDPRRTKIADIARRFVEVLPHVRYTAVGINFRSVVPMDQPQGFLKRTFLREGPWEDPGYPLAELGVRFAYERSGAAVAFQLDSVQAQPMGNATRSMMTAFANFHRPCPTHPGSSKLVIDYVSRLFEDWTTYKAWMKPILERVGSV